MRKLNDLQITITTAKCLSETENELNIKKWRNLVFRLWAMYVYYDYKLSQLNNSFRKIETMQNKCVESTKIGFRILRLFVAQTYLNSTKVQ
jgi:hypothetical protein